MITVPKEFAAWRIRADGEAGRAWIASLPALIERLLHQWGLRRDDAEVLHGTVGLVVLVHRRDEPLVLKVGWPADTTPGEAAALRAWQGHGGVRLTEAEPDLGALLMQRLDHTRSLHTLEIWPAAEIAGSLIRSLAVPAPPGLRTLTDVAQGIHQSLPGRQRTLGSPVPRHWLEAATANAAELAETRHETLLHADLHYGNVLADGQGRWLAVDPRPLQGDPEYSVPEMMWNRADDLRTDADIRRLLAILTRAADLDADIARAWVVTRCVDYWLWGLPHGLTIDPARCERILTAL